MSADCDVQNWEGTYLSIELVLSYFLFEIQGGRLIWFPPYMVWLFCCMPRLRLFNLFLKTVITWVLIIIF